jgi:hypothetical protein
MQKRVLFFCLPLLLLIVGCEKEEVVDLDNMALLEEEEDSWGELDEFLTEESLSPQEILIIEQPEFEIAEDELVNPVPCR